MCFNSDYYIFIPDDNHVQENRDFIKKSMIVLYLILFIYILLFFYMCKFIL